MEIARDSTKPVVHPFDYWVAGPSERHQLISQDLLLGYQQIKRPPMPAIVIQEMPSVGSKRQPNHYQLGGLQPF